MSAEPSGAISDFGRRSQNGRFDFAEQVRVRGEFLGIFLDSGAGNFGYGFRVDPYRIIGAALLEERRQNIGIPSSARPNFHDGHVIFNPEKAQGF